MRIKQLGNGGAFDTESTNSSFLIDIGTPKKRSLILFDCGYNVFAKLRELEKEDKDIIKDIEHIWISHLDDDHVGSLKSLIYYRYFIHGLTSAILKNDLEKSLIYFLSDINQTMSFGRLETTNIVFICNKDELKNGIYLPQQFQDRTLEADVISVGNLIKDIKVGNVVIFPAYKNEPIKIGEENYTIILHQDIVGIVNV